MQHVVLSRRAKYQRNLGRAALIAALVMTIGCSGSSGGSNPAAPTETPAPASDSRATVIVSVREFMTENPLAHAAVHMDGAMAAMTDASGTAQIDVVVGSTHTIGATAPDHLPSVTVTGTVNAPERWTFYLEPAE